MAMRMVMPLQDGVAWLGRAVSGRVPWWRIAVVLRWLLPVAITMFVAKLVKILAWRPVLPPGAGLGDGIKPPWERLQLLATESGLLRIAVAVAVLYAVKALFFPKRSSAWVLVVLVAGYLAMRLFTGLHDDNWSLDSWTVQKAWAETTFLYSLFRTDLIACIALMWLGVLACRAGGRPKPGTRHRWPLLLVIPLLLLLGLDLAHFLKTGLMGTDSMLAFLAQNAASTWFLLRTEIDAVAVAALLGPFLLLAFVPSAKPGQGNAGADTDPAWRFGLALLAITVLVASCPAIRFEPTYARFAGNPLVQMADDLVLRRIHGMSSAEIERSARNQPLLFDPRLAVAGTTKPRRNVVIVMMESVRASSTGLYEASLGNTPFLRKMASGGALVEQMYAIEPRTSAAWIAILDGIDPGDGDMFFYWGAREARHPTAVGLPKLLESQGYATGFFTATHLQLQNDQQLIDNFGFDHVVHHDEGADGPAPHPAALDASRFPKINAFGLEDRALLEPIAQWMDAQGRKGTPFLLTVMTNVGHYPYDVPADWPRHAYDGGANAPYSAYLDSIAYIDDFVRRLYGLFEERGLAGNTIFVVLGDHGESFGLHGPRQHFGQAYEEVLRIPAVIRADGLIRPGTRIAGLRQQTDILPTILALLDLKVTAGKPAGQSLLAPADPKRKLYFSGVYEDSTLGLRSGNFKYLYNFGRTPLEVYDLGRDPLELNDLGGALPPGTRRAVEKELLVWRASVNRALTQHEQ
ncbi:MAG: LTA synthase family protein [Gammaproteobacteria bacterium PRO9]|nr:LTA synthase family protein [Gammaproteobacteria bacterium PRO9]